MRCNLDIFRCCLCSWACTVAWMFKCNASSTLLSQEIISNSEQTAAWGELFKWKYLIWSHPNFAFLLHFVAGSCGSMFGSRESSLCWMTSQMFKHQLMKWAKSTMIVSGHKKKWTFFRSKELKNLGQQRTKVSPTWCHPKILAQQWDVCHDDTPAKWNRGSSPTTQSCFQDTGSKRWRARRSCLIFKIDVTESKCRKLGLTQQVLFHTTMKPTRRKATAGYLTEIAQMKKIWSMNHN